LFGALTLRSAARSVRFATIARSIAVACTVGAPLISPLGAQSKAPALSGARVTAQIVGGTLAAPVAFFGGGLASKRIAKKFGATDETASRAGYIGAYTATWLTTAALPAVIAGDGKFPAALAGSALGMLAAVGTVRIGNHLYDSGKRSCGVLCWTLGAAVFALPSIGAAVAYDQSRR
jgi:hypothetical protein